MESIIPEEEGEKREPEGRLTDGRASWPDVSALLCAALAMSIMAVAWGIFVLLTAASTVVLEFGGHKGEREPVCHATEDRTSWTDVVARLFLGLAESFRAVEWPSWKDLVIGAVVSVWGVGGWGLGVSRCLRMRSSTTALGLHGRAGSISSGVLSLELGELDVSCCLPMRSSTTGLAISSSCWGGVGPVGRV